MSEKLYKLLIAAIWTSGVIIKYSRVVVYRFSGISEEMAFRLEFAFFALLTLLALPYLVKHVKTSAILVYIVFALVYLYYMYASHTTGALAYLKENVWDFLLANITMLFVGSALVKDDYVNWLRLISILSIVANLLCILVMGTAGMNLSDDNMGLSYALVPHTCLLLFFSMKDRKKIDIICVILGALMIFAYGTRGPVLCLAGTFAGVWFLLNKERLTVSKVIGILLLFSLLFVVIWNIMPMVGMYLLGSGFSDRIVSMMMSGEITSDFGRSMIQDAVMDQIKRDPSGYGLAYDRNLLDLWGNSIEYSHNIVLELWISFGVIIGSVLFITLLILIIKGIRAAQTINVKGLLIVIVCGTGLMRLFVSGTFLNSPDTYLMIGMCLGLIDQNSHKVSLIKKRKIYA